MVSFSLAHALSWALCFALVAGGAVTVDPAVQIRNSPGTSDADTFRALGRALAAARVYGRDTVLKNSTTLDRSWDDATLLSLQYEQDVQVKKGSVKVGAGIEIICTTCYIKGVATAQLTIDGEFNATQELGDFVDSVKDEVDNVTTTAVDFTENYVKGVVSKFDDGIDLDDFDLPPVPIEFNVEVPDLPQCHLRFQFDGMELYMLVDTVISGKATYTLNLYTSPPSIGFAVGDDILVGVVVTVDLILSAEAEIDIRSGFHIKLDDGTAIDMVLFGKDLSKITLNGGKFEFLPVTVESSGAVLKAVLRIGARAGLALGTPDVEVFGLSVVPSSSAGIEAGVWANVAEFTTNITATPDEAGCALPIVETYQLRVGAAAGASVALGDKTWGPTPETQTPLFYTTLAEACAVSGRASPTTIVPTPAPSLAERQEDATDVTTTTISTEVAYTGVACVEPGLINCPPSLQSRTVRKTSLTLLTAVPSGVEATFPATTVDAVRSTVPFGKSVKALVSSTGAPKSFVPGPTSISEVLEGDVGGVSKKVILGVSIGLGVPVLIAVIAACIFFCKRTRYHSVSKQDMSYMGPSISEPYAPVQTPEPSRQEQFAQSPPPPQMSYSAMPESQWNQAYFPPEQYASSPHDLAPHQPNKKDSVSVSVVSR